MNTRGFSLIETMVATVVLGITVAGTYEGLQWIASHTHASNHATEADAVMAAAIEDLLALDDRSPLLSDDGDANDLDDLTNPDHVNNAAGAPWRQVVGGRVYNIAYNVARNAVYPNTIAVRIYVYWGPTLAAPQRVSRTITREVAPL